MSIPTPDSRWLKWNDGETHEIMITSHQAEQMRVHWTGSQYEPCTGPQCPWCRNGNKAKTRWSVDVICQDIELTWEMANLTYQDLQAIAQQFGGIHHLRLRVSRRGTGRNTRYTLIPLGSPTAQPQQAPATPQTQAPAAAPTQQQGPPQDLGGQMQYFKDLCAQAGLDPKAQFQAFLQSDGIDYADRTAQEQLPAVIEWLEAKTNGDDTAENHFETQSLADLL